MELNVKIEDIEEYIRGMHIRDFLKVLKYINKLRLNKPVFITVNVRRLVFPEQAKRVTNPL